MNTLLASSLPDASSFAGPENTLFFTLLWTCVGVVALLSLAALVFLVRYRQGSTADRSPSQGKEWHWEAGWTIVTTLIFVSLFVWGARLFRTMETPPPGTVDISVTGRQWMWDVRHADGRREFDTVHVVADQPTRLILASEDVIHSFFVPSFRIKQDVVPGKSVTAWFIPTKTGSYPIYCAQYCGSAHAQMVGRVIVLSQGAFNAWAQTRAGSDVTVSSGRKLYQQFGCAGCHDTGSPRAPAVAGVYGSLVHLANGTYLRADEAFLHDHLMADDPPRLAGYAPVMPHYRGALTENQAYALVSYLCSLQPKPEGPRT